MKRLHRFVAITSAAVSLLLSIVTVMFWVRARSNEDVFSRVYHGTRYTFISGGESIALYAPPPPARDPKVRQAAADIVADITSDQMKWVGWLAHEKPEIDMVDYPEPYYHCPLERAFQNFAPADLVNPLLAALEDSRRLTVVHLLLQKPRVRGGFAGPSMYAVPIEGPSLGRCTYQPEGYPPLEKVTGSRVNFAGLIVKLNRWHDDSTGGNITSLGECTIEMAGDPDLSQLPRIREQWHRKHDVPLAFVRDWQAVLILLVLPLTTLAFELRRQRQQRSRKREGLCPVCGYDVRASSQRCPECGVDIVLPAICSNTSQPSSS